MSTLRNKQYIQSTLHNFIDDNCIREMIVIDIDLFMMKFNKDTIRFIECKREEEALGKGQRIALEVLGQMKHPTYKIRSYIVTGNHPFLKVRIEDLWGHTVTMFQNEFLSWLNFDFEIPRGDE